MYIWGVTTNVLNETMIEANMSKKRPHLFHTSGRRKINNQMSLSFIYIDTI